MNHLMKKRKCKESDDESSPWPHLLPEILDSIAGNSHQDKLRLRAVCSPWRSAILLTEKNKGIISRQLPLQAPVHPKPTKTAGKVTYKSDDRYYLTAAAVYVIQPLNSVLPGWLLTVDEVSPGILSIRNPLKKTSLGYLPNDFPYEINLLDYRVTKISMMCNLTFLPSHPPQIPSLPRTMSTSYEKVVLIPNPACSSSSCPPYCFAVVLFGCGKAAALNLGTLEWKTIADGKGNKLDDIASHKGQLYGINKRGRAFCFAYGTWEKNVVAPATYGGLSRRKRFLESADHLYLVIRDVELSLAHRAVMPTCRVYRLNEIKHKWKSLYNLDNQILFVGVDHAFLVPPEHFPGCEGNRILFQDVSFPYHEEVPYFRRVPPSLDIRVFNMNNSDNSGLIHTLPQYASMMWPPPSWLKNDDSVPPFSMSRSIEEVASAARQVTKKYRLNVLSRAENDETPDRGEKLFGMEDIQDALNKISTLIKEVGRRYKRSGPPYHAMNQVNTISDEMYVQMNEFATSLSRALVELAK